MTGRAVRGARKSPPSWLETKSARDDILLKHLCAMFPALFEGAVRWSAEMFSPALPPRWQLPLSCLACRSYPGCFERRPALSAFAAFAAMTRATVLTVAAIEAGFWLYLVVLGLDDALPFVNGAGGTVAFLGTVVFVAFVLPALLLALAGRGLQLAACLSSIAAVLYLYDPFLRLTSALDGFALLAVIGCAVVVAAGGALYLASRPSLQAALRR
jgi:hypothetical protein